MSSQPEPTAGAEPSTWPALSVPERRVLGVLVEKAKTTPDIYPLSVNALVTGCNQKSNRDPVLNLTDVAVEEALTAAQKKGLVMRVIGSGRVERWRHLLYEAWRVEKVELAILAELLLRGPQTEGELRGRANRMEPIADVDTLRQLLKPLAERRLVVYLTPEGRRGTVLTHGFHPLQELERLHSRYSRDSGNEVSDPPPAVAVASTNLEAQTEIAELRSQLAELKTTVAALADQVRSIKEALGIQGDAPN
jgi:hypothetical protein